MVDNSAVYRAYLRPVTEALSLLRIFTTAVQQMALLPELILQSLSWVLGFC